MYDAHFGFTSKPFKLKADPPFYYPSTALRALADTITTAIRDYQPIIVLTGAAGSGKTSLLARCLADLNDELRLLTLTSTTLTLAESLDLIGAQLDLTLEAAPVVQKLQRLQHALLDMQHPDRITLLLIDDAHNLPQDALNTIVSLTRTPYAGRPVSVCLLAGLPKLSAQLPANIQGETLYLELAPLDEGAIADYVQHQLQVAGYRRQGGLFTPNSFSAIADYTGGNPRIINSLCDAALFITAMEGQRFVTAETIDKAAQQCFLKDPERVVYEYEPEEAEFAHANPEASAAEASDVDSKAAEAFLPPLEPMRLEGLSEPSAREVLGLRIGDVSQELAAAGVNWRSAEVSASLETTQAQPAVKVESTLTNTAPTISTATPVTAMPDDTIISRAQPPQPRPRPHRPAPALVLPDKPRKRSLGWLGPLGKLTLLLILLGLALWFKPEFFNLTRADVQRYASQARQSVLAVLGRTESAPTAAPVPRSQPQPATATATPATPSPATTSSAVAPVTPTPAPVPAPTPPAEVTQATATAPATPSITTTTGNAQPEPPPTPPAAAAAPAGTPVAPATEPPVTLTESLAIAPAAPTAAPGTDNGASPRPPQTYSDTPLSDPAPLAPAPEPASKPADAPPIVAPAPTSAAATPPTATVTDAEPAAASAELARIPELLQRAQRLVAERLLMTPADNNAYDLYQEILRIQSDNAEAAAGLDGIKSLYLRWAQTADQNGDWAKARTYYERALRIDPEDRAITTALDKLPPDSTTTTR